MTYMTHADIPEDEDPDDDHSVRLIYMLAGPIRYLSGAPGLAIALFLSCAILTVLSQVLGLLLWISLPLLDALYHRIKMFGGKVAALVFVLTLFVGLSTLTSFVVVPLTARYTGRIALPCSINESQTLRPQSRWVCFFNRHYVTPPVRAKLLRLADAMAKENAGMYVYYLDGSFPFFGFPMLPHLSHHDGRKIDLAFAYRRPIEESFEPSEPRSPIGYWMYEEPNDAEETPCKGLQAPLRWDFPFLQGFRSTIKIDNERTQAMLLWLLNDTVGQPIRKILIEQHLKTRMNIPDERVRFQGCGAARHDDHFHLEL